MDIDSTNFRMMHVLFFARILFSINSSITKNVACYLIRQDEETKELMESEFFHIVHYQVEFRFFYKV